MAWFVCFFLEKIARCHKLPSQTLLMGFLSYQQWPHCISSCSTLFSFPLASLSRDSFFFYFRESQKHTFHFHFWCLFSGQFGCELTNDDRHRVENSAEEKRKDSENTYSVLILIFSMSKKHRMLSEHFCWFSLDLLMTGEAISTNMMKN